jgi:cytidylate kinase
MKSGNLNAQQQNGVRALMFKVLTVTSEHGSGGSIVAQRVAEILRWTLLDRALIRRVARAARVDPETIERYDEHVDSRWHRFHRAGLQALALYAGIPSADAEPFDGETVAALTRHVITEAAESGECVIVGRGGQCILKDHRDVIHVFINGRLSERMARIRSRLGVTDAAELIRNTDHERAGYIRTHFGVDWKNPHLYQMMISSEMGIENAARMIIDAVLRSYDADRALSKRAPLPLQDRHGSAAYTPAEQYQARPKR